MKLALFVCLALAACGVGFENSQQRLRTAVDANRDKLDECYARSLEGDAELSGMMKVVMHVASSRTGGQGQIDDARVVNNQVADPELQNCVRQALVGIPIGPAPLDNDLDVEYTLAFQPQE